MASETRERGGGRSVSGNRGPGGGRRGSRGSSRGGSAGRGSTARSGARSVSGSHMDAGRDAPPPTALPANWPTNVTYLTTPFYAGISPRQRRMLQTQPADQPGAPASTPPLPEVPSILRFGPSPLVAIRAITDPRHPACGQRGLFAARYLPAGSFILPYLGVYHRGNVAVGRVGSGTNRHNKRESDYDLWLDRDVDVAVDADRQGNEARFVNDYRGTGQPRANAEFKEVWDPRRGERGMAVFVLPAGKRAVAQAVAGGGSASRVGGIAQGDEILVSYGKGFWEMRQKEAEAEAVAAATTETAQSGEGAEHAAPEAAAAQGCPAAAAASVNDRVGKMKVVAKFPQNLAFHLEEV